MNEWISVEDRLPEVDRPVIVSDAVGYMAVASSWAIREERHWTPSNIDSYDYSLGFEPTHWMPLPSPPKEQ